MGFETNNTGIESRGGTGTASARFISHGLVSAVARRAPGMMLDGGWGYEEPSELERYQEGRLRELFGNNPMPEGWTVGWQQNVSYAGEGPEPFFEYPGYRGTVVYRQDNSQPEGERMIPEIQWRALDTGPNAPA